MVVVGRIMIIFVTSVRASRESVDDEDNGISNNKAYAGNDYYDDADEDGEDVVYNDIYETVMLLLLLMMTNMMMTMMATVVIMLRTKMIMRCQN